MINSKVMSKYLGIIIGIVFVVLGFRGLCFWRGDFLTIVRGCLPVILIAGGAIAAISGISEIQDERSSKREKPE